MSEPTTETTRSLDRRTLAKVGIGFLVAVILLYIFGFVIGWDEIFGALATANLWWVAAACLSSAVCLTVWSKSWAVILSLLDVDIPFRSLIPTYYAATFADYITPFGKVGGGPFIAYVLSTDERANYEESLAGVLSAERSPNGRRARPVDHSSRLPPCARSTLALWGDRLVRSARARAFRISRRRCWIHERAPLIATPTKSRSLQNIWSCLYSYLSSRLGSYGRSSSSPRDSSLSF